MDWAYLRGDFSDHPKVITVLDDANGPAAIGLWTLTLTWAHRNTATGKTPGLVPHGLLRRYLGDGNVGPACAQLLVSAELWHTRPDGWLIHNFDKYLYVDTIND